MEATRRGPPMATLRERDDQLAIIAEAVGAVAAGEGRLLSVVGEAGLGKSTLLDAAAEQARNAGLTILRARGAELERGFPFGLVLQLLARQAPALDADGLFGGGARFARPLLLGERTAEEVAQGGAGPILHGLFWLVSALAERCPIALLIDDVHWADELSLRFVLHLFERAEDLPALVALATRPAEPGAPRELIARAVAHEHATHLRPLPLSPGAVAAVVEEAGFPGAARHDAFAPACHEVTGGNPLLLRELLLALLAEGATGTEADVGRVRDIGPESVSRAVDVALTRLPPAAEALARALAVLGDGASLRTAAELARLDLESAAHAAGALEGAGVFRREEGLGFVHPIVRTAVHRDLPPSQRAIAHRLAARILAPDAPPERVAAHLLVASPAGDAWAVDALERAAARAIERGAPAVAAAQLRRALEEPPDSAARPRVLAALARAIAAAGEPDAGSTYEQAAAAAQPGPERAMLLVEVGRTYTAANDLAAAATAFDRAASEAGDAHEELRLEAEAGWVMATMFDPSVGVAALGRVEALLAPGAAPRTSGQRKVLAHIASAEALRVGDLERGVELGRRAWGDGALLADTTAEDPVLGSVTAPFTFAQRFKEAYAITAAMLDDARRRGSALGYVTASYLRGQLMLRWGRPRDAIADLEVAVDGRRSGWEQYLPSAVAMLAECLFETGEAERADVLLAGAEEGDGTLAWASHFDHRGTIALERGAYDEALRCFERSRAIFEGVIGVTNPLLSPWRRGSAVALARLGRGGEALERVEEDLALARRWGAPGGIGSALAARGLVAGRGGIEDLAAGAALLDEADVPLPYARAALSLGSALRAAGRRTDAQEALRRALDAAASCGGERIAALAREELVAAGARPRRPRLSGLASLTPSELRVARMAAEGMSNREIAEALFVTRKAIQWHLGNAYRKLGIASREQLPAALSPEAGATREADAAG